MRKALRRVEWLGPTMGIMNTTIYFTAVTVIVVVFMASVLLKKNTNRVRSGVSSLKRSSMRHLVDLVPGAPLTAARIQRNTRAAVMGMGFHSIYERNLIFPPTVIASVSPEAYKMIEPYQQQLASELEANLPREAADEGWTVSGQLSITFEVDPSLTQDTVTVRPGTAMDAPATAHPSSPSRVTRVVRDDRVTHPLDGQARSGSVAQLWNLEDPDATPVTLQQDHEYTVGASSFSDIQVDRPDVSGMHASLKWRIDPATGQPEVWVRDIDSTNGTTVDGRRIDHRGAYAAAGCVIGLARSTRLRVTVGPNWSRATKPMGAQA